MSITVKTILLLAISNVFMLSAWYLHLKYFGHKYWLIAALISWGIAFFEYMVHIPANRIGSEQFALDELQIIQIGMSLILFIPFSMIVMGKPFRMDYIYAAMCMIGAAYFIFRK